MAIKKKVKQSNGVETAYHRIAMVKIDTNQQITVLVYSYLNEDGREYEKEYAAGNIVGEPQFPYVEAEYLFFDYEENSEMFKGNVMQKAYNWLKSCDKFKGAEDI